MLLANLFGLANRSLVSRLIKLSYIQNGSWLLNISLRCKKNVFWEFIFYNLLENMFIFHYTCTKIITLIGTIFLALAKNSTFLWKKSTCFIIVAKTCQKYTFSESYVYSATVGSIISANIITQFRTEPPKVIFLGRKKIDLEKCGSRSLKISLRCEKLFFP